MKKIILFCSLLLVFSCNSSNTSSSGMQDNSETRSKIILSPDKEYTLVINPATYGVNHFSVVKDKLKVYEDSYESGYVKWYDSHRLEIFKTPGIIPPSKNKNDFIIIYDVESKKSKTKTEIEGPDNN
ncbi:hypothetical protein [Fulvivirga lutea]|uniref:Lipoprotein n=1 Tax=Fulvivirga lutea TaxID=2810512 RepID=A0A974WF44_9BACT|nr:hypothetical protein [Fulvivirga lutea]QSE97288.1 hypothetical protein JR347_17150 [Fulvivirga lutea]